MNFYPVKEQYKLYEQQLLEAAKEVMALGEYIGGAKVKELEGKLLEFSGSEFCISCGNGTDALLIAAMALKLKAGDCVFMPAFTFGSCVEVILLLGATPVFVDVGEDFNICPISLEEKILQVKKQGKLKPVGIIAVDLFGKPCDYHTLSIIKEKYNLWLIQDGAQSFGSMVGNTMALSFGDISTTSFFPTKPLGCLGDGGAVFTSHEKLAREILAIKQHGIVKEKYNHQQVGINSRLDTLQAAFLLVKLKGLKNELERRNEIAKRYYEKFKAFNVAEQCSPTLLPSWAQYTLKLAEEKERENIREFLKSFEIPSMVYYPVPLHLCPAFLNFGDGVGSLIRAEKFAKTVISIPVHSYLLDEEVELVGDKVVEFLEKVRS